MTRSFVVTGTDTGIGKTVFAAALTLRVRGSYWKPIQAGLDDGSDRETVARLTGLGEEQLLPEAYRLTAPLSPHRASELDGIAIDPGALKLPDSDRPLVVEGAGGVLVPVTRQLSFADLFARWNLPVVLVARTSLGTINHSLLSIEALRSRGVPIHGVAFVGEANDDSERTIAEMGGVRRLGRLAHVSRLDAPTLGAAFDTGFEAAAFA